MRFVADTMLGKLAKWLRILGYDTLYWRELDDHQLIELAAREGRVLLTADRQLMKYRRAQKFFISKSHWREQLREVMTSFNMNAQEAFTRCVACNSKLEAINKEGVRDKVPLYIYKNHQEFGKCPSCSKVYWKGTHFRSAKREVEKIIKDLRGRE